MSWGYGNAGGGTGAGLIFDVVNKKPAKPKENTLYVPGDAVDSWDISPNDPGVKPAGNLWIKSKSNASITLSLLKPGGKKQVTVRILAVYRSNGNSWDAVRNCQVFTKGTWKSFNKYLYQYGEEFPDITGGWIVQQAYNIKVTKKSNTPSGYAIDFGVAANGGGWGFVGFCTKNKVDLSGFSTLRINDDFVVSRTGALHTKFGISDDISIPPKSTLGNFVAMTSSAPYNVPIDSANSEPRYVKLNMQVLDSTAHVLIKEVACL